MTYTFKDFRAELDDIKHELAENSGLYVVDYEDVSKMLDALEQSKET